MPIVQLGQVNDAPIQPTTSVAPTSTYNFVWANAKEAGGAYGIDDLLEDILKPIKAAIVSNPTSWQVKGNNEVLTNFISSFEEAATLSADKAKWLSSWKAAFQANPTIDISLQISNLIASGIGSITSGAGWLSDSFKASDGDAMFTRLIDNAMNNFMSKLVASQPKFLDVSSLEKQMDDEITQKLAKFNLKQGDKGVQQIIDLGANSLQKLEARFGKEASYQTTTPDRPYRVFSQSDAHDIVVDAFETSFHMQSTGDAIVTAAFNKAVSGSSFTDKNGHLVKNLKDILGFSPTDVSLDSRFMEVLAKVRDLNLKETPVEIFEKLLGAKAGDEFVDWYNHWDWLIEVSNSENYDQMSNVEVVSMHLKLKDGINIIPLDGKYPEVNTVFTNTKLQQTVQTNPLHVQSTTYIVDAFKNLYQTLTRTVDASKATISQDDLASLFGSVKLTDGVEKELVTPDELAVLDPIVFKDLKDQIEDIKNNLINSLKQTYKGFVYDSTKIKISFKLKYNDDGTSKTLDILPMVEDANVDDLPGITWGPSSKTPVDIQKSIDDVVKQIDSTHDKLGYDKFAPFEQKVVSALDHAASTLYGIFEKYKELANGKPYKLEVIRQGEKDGSSITPDIFENVFNGLKVALDKFNADNSRFKVEYTIEHLDDKSMKVKYKITDSNPLTISSTEFNGKLPLDNILITFNESPNKAQYWLDQLQKQKVDKSDFETPKSIADFGARKPLELTDAELAKIFSKFQEFKTQAKADGVELVADGVVKHQDAKGRDIYLQTFKASYPSSIPGDPDVSGEVDIPFTHVFVSSQQIEDVKSDIDEDAGKATKSVDGLVSDKDKAQQMKQQIADKQQDLKQQLDQKGITEDKLKEITGESKAASEQITNAAKLIKKASILEKLKDHFPGKNIPPEILKLFEKKWNQFEQVLEDRPDLLDNAKELAKWLNSFDAGAFMSAQRTMQTSGKIALMALGSMLGLGALIGGANSVKVATTNKKAINSKTGKIKSSKKLALLSAFIGLASAAGSIGTFLYLFISQGGL